jgi:hypothetical protein
MFIKNTFVLTNFFLKFKLTDSIFKNNLYICFIIKIKLTVIIFKKLNFKR